MIQDTYDILTSAIERFDTYGKNQVAERLIEAFFNTKNSDNLTEDQRNTPLERYKTVLQWLETGGLTSDGNLPEKPWLHCDHSFMIKQALEDDVLDVNGEPVVDKKGRPKKIGIIYKAQWRVAAALNNLNDSNANRAKIVPYWSPLHRRYYFDLVFGAEDPNSGPCDDSSMMGFVHQQVGASYSTMILCPRAFGVTRAAKQGVVYRPVDPEGHSRGLSTSTSDEVYDAEGEPQGVSKLAHVFPTVSTFLHELFHLVLGEEKSIITANDVNKEVYKVHRILKLAHGDAVRNAETYARMALASKYTVVKRTGPRVDGLVQWFTGYATIG